MANGPNEPLRLRIDTQVDAAALERLKKELSDTRAALTDMGAAAEAATHSLSTPGAAVGLEGVKRDAEDVTETLSQSGAAADRLAQELQEAAAATARLAQEERERAAAAARKAGLQPGDTSTQSTGGLAVEFRAAEGAAVDMNAALAQTTQTLGGSAGAAAAVTARLTEAAAATARLAQEERARAAAEQARITALEAARNRAIAASRAAPPDSAFRAHVMTEQARREAEQWLASNNNVIFRAPDRLATANERVAKSTERVGQEAKKASAYTTNMGLATLQAAQFADDLQYGMKGIINNIPILLLSLGMSGGVAGVISLLAVGFHVAAQKLDLFSSSASMSAKELREVALESGRAAYKSGELAQHTREATEAWKQHQEELKQSTEEYQKLRDEIDNTITARERETRQIIAREDAVLARDLAAIEQERLTGQISDVEAERRRADATAAAEERKFAAEQREREATAADLERRARASEEERQLRLRAAQEYEAAAEGLLLPNEKKADEDLLKALNDERDRMLKDLEDLREELRKLPADTAGYGGAASALNARKIEARRQRIEQQMESLSRQIEEQDPGREPVVRRLQADSQARARLRALGIQDATPDKVQGVVGELQDSARRQQEEAVQSTRRAQTLRADAAAAAELHTVRAETRQLEADNRRIQIQEQKRQEREREQEQAAQRAAQLEAERARMTEDMQLGATSPDQMRKRQRRLAEINEELETNWRIAGGRDRWARDLRLGPEGAPGVVPQGEDREALEREVLAFGRGAGRNGASQYNVDRLMRAAQGISEGMGAEQVLGLMTKMIEEMERVGRMNQAIRQKVDSLEGRLQNLRTGR